MMKIYGILKKWYDRLNIQTKFTLCILIAVVIPILALAVAFSGRLYDMVIADTIRSEQASSAQTAPLIEEELSRIIGIHAGITGMAYYHALFDRPVDTPLSGLSQTPEARAFSKDIRKISEDSPVSAVRIYLDIPGEENFFSADSSRDLFLPMSAAKGTYWYGIFQGSRVTSLHCPSFYLGNRELQSLGDSAYITSASLQYGESSYPCYLAVYYSSEPFHQILADGISFPGSVSYILNDRESLIASTDDYLAGMYRLSYSDVQDSLMSSNNFIERSVLGEKIYVGFYYITDPQWLMVTVLPSKPLIEKGALVILKFTFVCLFCILVSAAVAIRQSRSITVRISSVVRQMTQIRKGPPVPMPAPVIRDEVGELILTYNYMTEKMNLLIERQQKTAEELRIAEFNSLQAQINPHFLYNTMDMINWMALQGRAGEVSSVVQSLSRFYKLTLSRKKNFSTIENELEHVTIYVQLQNMRYQNAIDFVVDMPDELLGYGIPKLTLQPIVENAILHGLLEKEEKSGSIVITGWTEEADIVLLVSDNGVGIPADLLPLILSDDRTAGTKGTNIAVSNIHKRLKLLYGPAYGLSYQSAEGLGTDVSIRLPMRSADTEEKRSLSLYGSYPLSTVVDTGTASGAGVTTSELLAHCEKLRGNTLTLESLSAADIRLPQGESICLLYHQVTADFPCHNHAYLEMAYVCQGQLVMAVDGHELLMKTGDLVILDTKASHSLKRLSEPAVLLNICVAPRLLDGALGSLMEDKNILSDLYRQNGAFPEDYLFLCLEENPKYASCLTDMLETYILYDYHTSPELIALLHYFFSLLVCSESYRFGGVDEHTSQMIRYIRKHGPSSTPEQTARRFQFTAEEMEGRLLRLTGRGYDSYAGQDKAYEN